MRGFSNVDMRPGHVLSPFFVVSIGVFITTGFRCQHSVAVSSIRIDFIFSSLPYERQAIDRAIDVDLSGVPVPFASAEDLILHKLFAGRPRDIEDASGVVVIKGDSLDWDYIEGWVEEFSSVTGRETLPETLNQIRSDL